MIAPGHKVVLLPVEVPQGLYCVQYVKDVGTTVICQHYDNEGGHSSCAMGFSIWRLLDDNGVMKADECLNLEEQP